MDDLTKQNHQYRKQTKRTLIGVALVAALVLIAYFAWFGILKQGSASTDPTTWGLFGDFVGGIMNPIVALCALYWLTRSIEIQWRELSAAQQELASTRMLIAEQVKTAEKQRFEDTFFALLNQHNEALRYLTEGVAGDSQPRPARDIHRAVFSSSIKNSLSTANIMLHKRNREVGHYFRILYQLLKLIATRCPETTLKGDFTPENILASKPSSDEKLYSNIIRSFLDVEMTQLLAVNCYCKDDMSPYWNFKCLIERYSFLEHMPFSSQSQDEKVFDEVVLHYRKIAFGKSTFRSGLLAKRKELRDRLRN